MSLNQSEVLARLKPFGISFEKSLGDLIRGIRSHSKVSPDSLLAFLDAAIQECKLELQTTDMETKAMAVLKLTYLEMYGFDMSWCNFQILEVMLSAKFQQKRIGYLAAIQLFQNERDLLILATNQFKKDLNSHNAFEIGLALSGIATIVTPHLLQDINEDVLLKLTHLKPYIRKKAVLAMYKVFLQYPELLRANYTRVLDMLDDADVLVVSAAINVICEISKKSPTVFVQHLPRFFRILEETKNNWLTIRILKLFSSLLQVEPRMKKKILPTIMALMLLTQASSLVYECINCIVSGTMLLADSLKDRDTARVCVDHLMRFFELRDANLKFVGLLALINIIKLFPTLMHRIKGVPEVVMECLTDADLIIKTKALGVCHYLVNDDNMVDVVNVLLKQLVPGAETVPESLKLDITLKILAIAAQDNYANVPNFRWYVAVLKDVVNLTLLPLPTVNTATISPATSDVLAAALGGEFKTLATKIPAIRGIIVHGVIFPFVQDVNVVQNCPLLLPDFYWIMGEYVDADDDEVEVGVKLQTFNCLVNHFVDVELGNVSELQFGVSAQLVQADSRVLVVLIQALVKLYDGIVTDYVRMYSDGHTMSHHKYLELAYLLSKLIQFVKNWETHPHYEVQERATSWLEFLKVCLELMCGDDMSEVDRLRAEEVARYRKVEEDVRSLGSLDGLDSLDELDSLDDEEEANEEDEGEEPKEETPPANPFQDDKLSVLVTRVLPSFFKAYPLNPVLLDSQRNIAVPLDLDLSQQIHPPPFSDLSDLETEDDVDPALEDDSEALIRLSSEDDLKKRERLDRQKYDPYYISSDKETTKGKTLLPFKSGTSSPSEVSIADTPKKKHKPKKIAKESVVILSEEKIEGNAAYEVQSTAVAPSKKKKSTLRIDSLNLDNFNLDSPGDSAVINDHEYDIDLDELRSKLARTELKQKKKKTGKKHKTRAREPTAPEVAAETLAAPGAAEALASPTPADAPESDTAESTPTPAVIPIKKSKKKKKAVIIE